MKIKRYQNASGQIYPAWSITDLMTSSGILNSNPKYMGLNVPDWAVQQTELQQKEKLRLQIIKENAEARKVHEFAVLRDPDNPSKSYIVSTNAGAMSGTDSVGEFVLTGIAMDPLFKGAGAGLSWLGRNYFLPSLAKAGNNWARAKIISGAIDDAVTSTGFSGLSNGVAGVTVSKSVAPQTIDFGYQDPKDQYELFKLWRAKNPDAKLTKPSINGSYIDGTRGGEHWLTVANIAQPDNNIDIARYWAGRTKNIGVDPSTIWSRYADVNGYVTTMHYPTKIEALATKPTKLGIPIDKSMSRIKGMHVSGATEDYNVLMTDPWRPKSYDYTMFHEGFMHPTQDDVFDLTIPLLKGKSVYGAYSQVANPIDIIDKSIIDELYTTSGSTYAKEARAINGELVKKVIENVAKLSNKSVKEITLNPKYIEEVIDKNFLGNPERMTKFLRSMNSGYANDWAKILESPKVSAEAKNKYLHRLIVMMKYLPSVATTLSIANESLNGEDQNTLQAIRMKSGGKLNYLNYIK